MLQESFNEKYYSLDQISDYRSEYIDLRIQWFIETYELVELDWPLDCVALLDKMAQKQTLPFSYGFYELPTKYDAITEYLPEHNVYLLQINERKVNYPFTYSRDRRLNFTIAHEIGHMVLDHLAVPRDLKTERELYLEELEANEFAGRLILPEKVLYTCNFYSLDSVAAHFLVSKTALWKRLNNMKRLSLLSSKKVRSCNQCGNTRFSAFAEYCGVCGQEIRNNLRGVRRIYYPDIVPMDRYKRAKQCPRCGNQALYNYDDCPVCKTGLINYCTSYFADKADECSYANPGNARYCEICGKPTYYYTKRILDNWNDSSRHYLCEL